MRVSQLVPGLAQLSFLVAMHRLRAADKQDDGLCSRPESDSGTMVRRRFLVHGNWPLSVSDVLLHNQPSRSVSLWQ